MSLHVKYELCLKYKTQKEQKGRKKEIKTVSCKVNTSLIQADCTIGFEQYMDIIYSMSTVY